MRNKPKFAASLLALWSAAVLADAPEVTPYRPTVSNPAALSAPHLLEVEAGLAWQRGDAGARLFSVPYLFKYAFTENAGVLLGGDGYLNQKDADGNRLTGIGDTAAEIKLRHEITESTAIGVETGVRFPTARTGLGAEKSDYIVNGIFSTAFGEFNVDVNLGYTRLGSVDANQGHGEMDWATALSGKIRGPWGWAAELSGAGQRGVRGSTQALGALSYQPSRLLVLDCGLSHDLNGYTNQTVLFAGFAYLFDRQ